RFCWRRGFIINASLKEAKAKNQKNTILADLRPRRPVPRVRFPRCTLSAVPLSPGIIAEMFYS
ncbi:hypothetical protein ACLD28_06550, partial [Salmonella sp. 741265080_HBA]